MKRKTKVIFQPFSECISYQNKHTETVYKSMGDKFGLLMDIEYPEKCIGVKLELASFEDHEDALLMHLINLKSRTKISIIEKLKILYSILKRWK